MQYSSSRQNLSWLVSPKSQNYSNCDLILALAYELEHNILFIVMSIRDILIAACFDIGLSFISLHLSYRRKDYWYRYMFLCRVRKCGFVFLCVLLCVRYALIKLTTCFIWSRLLTCPFVFIYMRFHVLCTDTLNSRCNF